MKIGILTFHASNNCGSMLQGYALQKYLLKEFEVKSDIIDFSNENQRDMYALFRKMDSMKDIGLNLTTLMFFKRFKKHFDDYKKFSNEYLIKSNEDFVKIEELNKLNGQYDGFICGSDQVWNTNCYDSDDAYYLPFVKEGLKIAYAPSFGATNIVNVDKKNNGRYKKFLRDFNSLSCRERNGAKWIEELTGKNIPVVLDPTLLLTKSEWNDLAGEERLIKEDYIFYYAFRYSPEVNAEVMKVAKKLNMPVYILDSKSWVKDAARFGIKLTKNSGPISFVNFVRNASLVLTTSFHGTAFSVLFEKPFWFINSKMHSNNSNDDRVETLLDELGILDRKVNLNLLNTVDVKSKIDYKLVNYNLDKSREKSKEYLKQSLKVEK